jgi:hypothetical protein
LASAARASKFASSNTDADSSAGGGSLRRKYVPVSLIRKKWVPWALSGLPAVRPAMFRFGLDMIGLPSRGSARGRSGIVRPVHPVSEMRIASSRSVRGVRGASEVQLIEPASIELPRLIRCVRRCQIELSSGRSRSASRPPLPSV